MTMNYPSYLSRNARSGSLSSLPRGFSLIELLIVVAIILIIAAIAIPNLLRSRMAANEASAVAALKVIGVSNATYSAFYGQGYAGTLAQLGPTSGGCAIVGSACADLIDSVLSGVEPPTATPVKSGYRFTYTTQTAAPDPTSPNFSYTVVATPANPGSSGQSTFCFDNLVAVYKDTSGAETTGTDVNCLDTWVIGGSISPL